MWRLLGAGWTVEVRPDWRTGHREGVLLGGLYLALAPSCYCSATTSSSHDEPNLFFKLFSSIWSQQQVSHTTLHYAPCNNSPFSLFSSCFAYHSILYLKLKGWWYNIIIECIPGIFKSMVSILSTAITINHICLINRSWHPLLNNIEETV